VPKLPRCRIQRDMAQPHKATNNQPLYYSAPKRRNIEYILPQKIANNRSSLNPEPLPPTQGAKPQRKRISYCPSPPIVQTNNNPGHKATEKESSRHQLRRKKPCGQQPIRVIAVPILRARIGQNHTSDGTSIVIYNLNAKTQTISSPLMMSAWKGKLSDKPERRNHLTCKSRRQSRTLLTFEVSDVRHAECVIEKLSSNSKHIDTIRDSEQRMAA